MCSVDRDPRTEPSNGLPIQHVRDLLSQRLAPGTVYGYKRLWKRRIEPEFGHRRLKDLKPSLVRSWVARMSRDGLGASEVRHAFRLLSLILNAAVGDEHLAANPCAAVRRNLPRTPTPDPVILSPDEVRALRQAKPEGRDRLLFDVLAFTGVRIGEVLALRRRSVDPLRRRLLVTEGVTEPSGLQVVGDTKTHQQRSITLPQFLLDALVAHLAALARRPGAWLWPSRTGKPRRYGSYRRNTWDKAVIRAGLAERKPDRPKAEPRPGKPGPKPKADRIDLADWSVLVTPHALRATHASVIAAKYGVMEAARRLGHASSTVTTAHYARPLRGADEAVAEWLDGMRPADQGDQATR